MYIVKPVAKVCNRKTTLAVTVEHMYSMVPIFKSSYSKKTMISLPNLCPTHFLLSY